jgi:hypothetical protein
MEFMRRYRQSKPPGNAGSGSRDANMPQGEAFVHIGRVGPAGLGVDEIVN